MYMFRQLSETTEIVPEANTIHFVMLCQNGRQNILEETPFASKTFSLSHCLGFKRLPENKSKYKKGWCTADMES